MEIAIREPKTAGEFEKYYDLRWRILRAPWTHERTTARDEYEQQSIHLTAWAGDKLVGTGRLHFVSADEAQVRSMAVENGFERQGIGSLILRGLEERAAQKGARSIVLNARDSALPFYRKHQYELVDRSYTLFDSIVHWRMRKAL
jgi:N-acetylglutamate synthase-like GNAT family acetyltransferase